MKNDDERGEYSAPRTPGQAEGTEDDVSGKGHSADESAEAPKPSQAEGEEEGSV